MPKRVKTQWLIDYLSARKNNPVSKEQIATSLSLSVPTIRKHIRIALEENPALPLVVCVYHNTEQRSEIKEGKEEMRAVTVLRGGYMIFDPVTATDETRDILRDTFDWWDQLHDSVQRMASQMFDKKPISILIPAKLRKQISEHAGEYEEKAG